MKIRNLHILSLGVLLRYYLAKELTHPRYDPSQKYLCSFSFFFYPPFLLKCRKISYETRQTLTQKMALIKHDNRWQLHFLKIPAEYLSLGRKEGNSPIIFGLKFKKKNLKKRIENYLLNNLKMEGRQAHLVMFGSDILC